MEIFLQRNLGFLFQHPEFTLDWFLWVLIFIFWSAITINMQRTTLIAGKSLVSSETLEHTPTGFQDMLTPKWQTRNQTIWFGIIFMFVLVTFYWVKWWFAVPVLLISSIFISIIRNTIAPREMSAFWLGKILNDMISRQNEYREANDSSKEEAIKNIIEKFENLYASKERVSSP